MPDYAKTIIYRLVCNDTNIKECYVGSTTNMIKRKQQHKAQSSKETSRDYNKKKYIFIRNNGGFENWSMIMIEEFPCENNLQSRQRERYYQEFFNASLNSQNAFIEKEEVKQYQHNYHIENEEKIQSYYLNDIENRKLKQQQYNKKRVDEIKEYQKEYRKKNKDKLNEYNRKYKEQLKNK